MPKHKHTFQIQEPDDDHSTIVLDGEAILSLNHDEHGSRARDEVHKVVRRLAVRLGVREIPDGETSPPSYATEERNPIDMDAFRAVWDRGHGCTVAWDGEVLALVAGDMGYDGTGINLGVMVAHAMGHTGLSDPRYLEIERRTEELIRLCLAAIPGGTEKID